jgi:hypothetical protein
MIAYHDEPNPKDSAAEWLIKGSNIGLYFGLVFAYWEVKKGPMYIPRYLGNVAGTIAVTGGTLGTWMFFAKSLGKQRGCDDAMNYSVGSVLTTLIWHKAFGLPTNRKLAPIALAVGVLGGVLGSELMVKQDEM